MSSIGETLRSHEGYCPCCRSATNFTVHGTWLREDYRCDRCGSIPRQRHLITVLDFLYPRWRKQRLNESSPAPPMLVHHSKRYESSQYLPGVPLGSVKDGVRCENIEKLTLKDRSLDLFVHTGCSSARIPTRFGTSRNSTNPQARWGAHIHCTQTSRSCKVALPRRIAPVRRHRALSSGGIPRQPSR